MIDGGRTRVRTVIRKQKGRGKGKKQRRRYKAEWREPKLLIVFAVDDQGRLKKGTRPKGDDTALAALINKPAPPPGKAFDNLYYVGAQWVSAWAIDTPEGIILIDALNSGKEAAQLIEGGLRAVGLDPARLKYIVITHGHGDHYGGVSYLVDKYHPAVVMSDLDWKMTATQLEFETPLWDPPPKFA